MKTIGEHRREHVIRMKKNAFSRLRDEAAAGDTWSKDRLQRHVQSRVMKGWGLPAIAKRLGMELADVARLVGSDRTPRLVSGGSTVTECPWSAAELWMARKLSATRRNWTRKAPGRFWQYQLGVLLELEGPEHAGGADSVSERAAFYERGVMLIRVEEFNESDAVEALWAIRYAEPWNARRRALGLAAL